MAPITFPKLDLLATRPIVTVDRKLADQIFPLAANQIADDRETKLHRASIKFLDPKPGPRSRTVAKISHTLVNSRSAVSIPCSSSSGHISNVPKSAWDSGPIVERPAA